MAPPLIQLKDIALTFGGTPTSLTIASHWAAAHCEPSFPNAT